jgi:hypothetical protein
VDAIHALQYYITHLEEEVVDLDDKIAKDWREGNILAGSP